MPVPRTIVLTGATRGCGRALAREFARAGHTVHGCGRSKKDCESLAKELGPPHTLTPVDVSDDAQVKAWAEKTLKKGPPDLLLNLAALMNDANPLWKVPQKEFDALIDVNIKGTANVLRHFLPAMIQTGTGVIVNFSSGWGRSTAPEVAPYCASKYAIEGLTLALAQELPPGLAAIPLNPGVINTDMLQQCWAAEAAAYPTPEHWAKTAAPYILSLSPKHNGKSLSIS